MICVDLYFKTVMKTDYKGNKEKTGSYGNNLGES